MYCTYCRFIQKSFTYRTCAVLCLVTQLCLTLCDPMYRLLCPWGFSRQEFWSRLPCPPPEDLPNPGIEPRSPTFQANSLPSEPPGKPKNTRVGSLSFLQGNFLTQESNQGFLQVDSLLAELHGKPTYRIVSTKKILCVPPIHPLLPFNGNHRSFFPIYLVLRFPGSYSWSHTVCSFLRWILFWLVICI